jgi:hypothetical protein
MVYSRVTTSPMVEPLPFFSPFLGDISKQTEIGNSFLVTRSKPEATIRQCFDADAKSFDGF